MAITRWPGEIDYPTGYNDINRQMNRMVSRFFGTGLDEQLFGTAPPVDIPEEDND